MTLRHRLVACSIASAMLVAGCGFHLRKEAQLPDSMQRVYVAADPNSPLIKDLKKALPRSGAVVVDAAVPEATVLKFTQNAISTDVLAVSGTARANEYAIRYHVEFDVETNAGTTILPMQSIELTRELTFDATQALGVSAEIDLLSKELEQDMLQTILRRLEALGKAAH